MMIAEDSWYFELYPNYKPQCRLTEGFVYCIENNVNGRKYVGCTQQYYEKRWGLHRTSLRKGKHYSVLMQKDFKDGGFNCFSFKILEIVLIPDTFNDVSLDLSRKEAESLVRRILNTRESI